MIVNGSDLLKAKPIYAMFPEKQTAHGVSYGLSEAGYDIRIKQELTFHRAQRFHIASAVEKFQMPDDLVAVVHDKSTWARRGLSVFNTVIEPGWNGYLTLELVYHGPGQLVVPANAGIAQCLFHKVTQKAAYSGKYQDQPDEPVAARDSRIAGFVSRFEPGAGA